MCSRKLSRRKLEVLLAEKDAYITTLEESARETSCIIDRLDTTNSTLKAYINYLKRTIENRGNGCEICSGKINWTHKFDEDYVEILYCPKCGRKMKTSC